MKTEIVKRLDGKFNVWTQHPLSWYDSDFQSSVLNRATWKSPEGYYLDIFVDETDRDFLVIDELNCQTVQEAISFIDDYILEMGTNPYMEDKRTKLLKYI